VIGIECVAEHVVVYNKHINVNILKYFYSKFQNETYILYSFWFSSTPLARVNENFWACAWPLPFLDLPQATQPPEVHRAEPPKHSHYFYLLPT